jgi:hypothetical protein
MTDQDRLQKCAELVKRLAWDWDRLAQPYESGYITREQIQREARLLAPLVRKP